LKALHLVLVEICTRLGCVPLYRPQVAPPTWARLGKAASSAPATAAATTCADESWTAPQAPLNLPVRPYFYVSDTALHIGELADGRAQNWALTTW
jgi:ubiquinol-cytochrome c reductase iron-sulfur subunit